MILKFDEMELKTLPHFKGGEKELVANMFSNELGKILLGRLEPGATIGVHTHETDSEAIYLVSGTANVLYDGEEYELTAGNCHYCPKGHTHSLRNFSDETIVFFAVVPMQ